MTFEDGETFPVTVSFRCEMAENGWLGRGKLSSGSPQIIEEKKGYATLSCKGWRCKVVVIHLDKQNVLSVLSPHLPVLGI